MNQLELNTFSLLYETN